MREAAQKLHMVLSTLRFEASSQQQSKWGKSSSARGNLTVLMCEGDLLHVPCHALQLQGDTKKEGVKPKARYSSNKALPLLSWESEGLAPYTNHVET